MLRLCLRSIPFHLAQPLFRVPHFQLESGLEACKYRDLQNSDSQVLEEYGTAASMLPPLPPPSSASMQPSGVT